MFLKSIDEVRNIRWSRSYLWDLKFLDAPPPFNNWFPATDIDDLKWSVGAWEAPGFLRRIPIPSYVTDLKRVRISFIDDVLGTLEHWMDHWVNEIIFDKGRGVATAEEAVKRAQLIRYNESRKIIRSVIYDMFPYSEFPYNGRSAAVANEYSIEFFVWSFHEMVVSEETGQDMSKSEFIRV